MRTTNGVHTGVSAKGERRPAAGQECSALEADLRRYASEFYTRGDLDAGIRFVKEVAGGLAVVGGVLTVLTCWTPFGLALSAGTIAHITYRVANGYAELDRARRKQVRAAVRWLQGGFDLGDHLKDD